MGIDALATETLDIVALMPADTPEYMVGAWVGCLQWAAGVPELVERFHTETGVPRQGRTPLERLVDGASGFNRNIAEQFVRWANVNVWGEMGGPDAPQPPES